MSSDKNDKTETADASSSLSPRRENREAIRDERDSPSDSSPFKLGSEAGNNVSLILCDVIQVR